MQFSVVECSFDIWKCHCSKCRKTFGGASSAATFVSENKFQWDKGEENIYRYELNPGYSKQFCKTCGSIVPQLVVSHSPYWVPAGLFEEDPGVTLGRHVHIDSKAPWEILDSKTEQLSEGFEF